jgi:uncharacterized protein (TIGR02996 family)
MSLTVEEELERAADAASLEEALEGVCRAWAACPSTRLSALARDLGRLVRVEAIEGENEARREVAWQEVAGRGERRALPSLLATPWSRKPAAALRRLEALGRLGPDPRIVHALLELDTGRRFTSGAGFRFWRQAYGLLLSWGSLEAAARVNRWPPPQGHASEWEAARFRVLFEPLMREWVTRWPEEPPLPAAALPHVERLEARAVPEGEAAGALLAAVQAAPDDDGPRLVFADALSERGDPRGEFITLQFAHERGELTLGQREQMKRLLQASGPAWFDGLQGQVDPVAVFRRGFLSEVRLATREPDASRPGWRTVESLDAAGLALPLAAFLTQPHLARVTSLRSLSAATFHGLLRECDSRRFELLELEQVAPMRGLAPRLETDALRLLVPPEEAMHFLAASGLHAVTRAVQLRALEGIDLAAVVAQLERECPGIRRLEVVGGHARWPLPWLGPWKVTLAREASGRFGSAEVLCVNETLQGLGPALASLPRQLERIVVRTTARRGPLWRQSVADLVRGSGARGAVELLLDKPVVMPPARVVHEGR